MINLHALRSACGPWSIDAIEIEEDLTEFRSSDQQLLDITRAQHTTATKLLESSDYWTTWQRFKERDPQRVQDMAYLENYVEVVKNDLNNKNSRFKFGMVGAVKAAHSRMSRDLYDLLVILASVDSTHKYIIKKHDRDVERLERRLAATEGAIAEVSLKLRQNMQERGRLEEEDRVWGVTAIDWLAIWSSIRMETEVLGRKEFDLLR